MLSIVSNSSFVETRTDQSNQKYSTIYKQMMRYNTVHHAI